MILGLLMLACEPPEPPLEGICADVSAEKGHLVCLHRIDGRADWDRSLSHIGGRRGTGLSRVCVVFSFVWVWRVGSAQCCYSVYKLILH